MSFLSVLDPDGLGRTLSKHCVRRWSWEVQLLGAVQHRVNVKGPFLNRNTEEAWKKNHLENLPRIHMRIQMMQRSALP